MPGFRHIKCRVSGTTNAGFLAQLFRAFFFSRAIHLSFELRHDSTETPPPWKIEIRVVPPAVSSFREEPCVISAKLLDRLYNSSASHPKEGLEPLDSRITTAGFCVEVLQKRTANATGFEGQSRCQV